LTKTIEALQIELKLATVDQEAVQCRSPFNLILDTGATGGTT
jgi:hypothetical protein